jgi:apolipoprotein N-acyltransferase
MLVNNSGRIVKEARNQSDFVLAGDLPSGRHWTLYSVFGDWVLYLSGAYWLFEVGRGLVLRSRHE